MICEQCKKTLEKPPKKKLQKKEFWDNLKFKNWNEFMNDCLERSRIRMEKEMGYGIPEK